jgi:hypothetical protein
MGKEERNPERKRQKRGTRGGGGEFGSRRHVCVSLCACDSTGRHNQAEKGGREKRNQEQRKKWSSSWPKLQYSPYQGLVNCQLKNHLGRDVPFLMAAC